MNIGKARGKARRRSIAAEKTHAVANKAAVTFGRLLATVILVCVLAGCICVCVAMSYVMSFADSKLDIPLENLALDYTSVILAQDETTGTYYTIENLYSDENRIWASSGEIPDVLRKAFMAVEDQRFLEHDGVDWKRTILSFVNLVVPIYNQKSGGSTITQQLIKNISGEDDVKIDRKIKEIMRAINLEKEYDKDEIIVAYLNTIYLGANSYGVKVAARTYFNKDLNELTVAECAAIAAITKNPDGYNPFKHEQKNKERKEYVLSKMNELGFITEDDYYEALDEELTFAKEEYSKAIASRQSYFVDEVRRQVVRDLCDKLGWEESYARTQLLTGGYKIYATIDPEVQAIMDEVYADPETFYQFEGKPDEAQPQSAMIIMKNDGRVVGVVGARGEKTYSMSLNYATMTKRQLGSAIKPLTVYSVGIEEGLFNYSTIFDDHNLKTDENWTLYDVWMPKNSYSAFRGKITVAEAIARSCNTIAAQIIVDYNTPERSFEYATQKYRLSTLVKKKVINGKTFTDEAAAPMTLGALTDGAILQDVVAAYEVFTNGGFYSEPYYYTKVENADGNTVLQHLDESERVISEETSYIMSKLLRYTVTYSAGTCRTLAFGDMTICAKTGTTNENKDKWCIGFTPYYLGGVWTGYDSYSTTYTLPSTNTSLIVLKAAMEKIHTRKNLPNKEVQEQPVGITTRYFCKDTGFIAGANCPNKQIGYYRREDIDSMHVCTHTYELLDPVDDTSSEDASSDVDSEAEISSGEGALPSDEPHVSSDIGPSYIDTSSEDSSEDDEREDESNEETSSESTSSTASFPFFPW